MTTCVGTFGHAKVEPFAGQNAQARHLKLCNKFQILFLQANDLVLEILDVNYRLFAGLIFVN